MGYSNDITTPPVSDAVPHLVKLGWAKAIDLSLGRQEVNAVIFATA